MTSRNRHAGADRGAAGFTLIEMLVVLVVIALMAGLVVARGPSHSVGLDMRLATATVVGELRRARAEAIAGDREVAVIMDTARHGIRVGAAAPRALPADIVFGAGTVTFAPDGSAIATPIILSAGDRRVTIGVGWLTGRVSVATAGPVTG